MREKFRKSEANRVLVDWARNMRQGYEDLRASSMDFSDFVYGGGRVHIPDDYSLEEKYCLHEMMLIHKDEPDLYRVADLEYIKQATWYGNCREYGGWYSVELQGKVPVTKDKLNRDDFLRYVQVEYRISKTQFYNRLNRLQRRIYNNVVMI